MCVSDLLDLELHKQQSPAPQQQTVSILQNCTPFNAEPLVGVQLGISPSVIGGSKVALLVILAQIREYSTIT